MRRGVWAVIVIIACACLLLVAIWSPSKPPVEEETPVEETVEENEVGGLMLWDEVVSIRTDDEYTIPLNYCYGGDFVKGSFEADAPINLYIDAPYGAEYMGVPIYAMNYARNGTFNVAIPYSGMVIVHFHNPSHLEGRSVCYNLTYVKGAGKVGALMARLSIPEVCQPVLIPLLEAVSPLYETLSAWMSRYRAARGI